MQSGAWQNAEDPQRVKLNTDFCLGTAFLLTQRSNRVQKSVKCFFCCVSSEFCHAPTLLYNKTYLVYNLTVR